MRFSYQKRRGAPPRVCLHDCALRRINVQGRDLVLNFAPDGFFVWVPEQGRYFRAYPARLTLQGFDPDSLSIQEDTIRRDADGTVFHALYDVAPREFQRRINAGALHAEFVQEFCGSGGAHFVLWCERERQFHVSLSYRALLYEWDAVDLNAPY